MPRRENGTTSLVSPRAVQNQTLETQPKQRMSSKNNDPVPATGAPPMWRKVALLTLVSALALVSVPRLHQVRANDDHRSVGQSGDGAPDPALISPARPDSSPTPRPSGVLQVVTDRRDYPPGATAFITGAGFWPGET